MKPRIYQATNEKWIVIFNDTKSDYFNTESEAKNMATKLTFATQAQIETTTLAQLVDKLSNLESVYFDRGYNAGGGNQIVDADLASLGITASQLGSLITLIQQLNNFFNNSTVISGDYDATLNMIRSDM